MIAPENCEYDRDFDLQSTSTELFLPFEAYGNEYGQKTNGAFCQSINANDCQTYRQHFIDGNMRTYTQEATNAKKNMSYSKSILAYFWDKIPYHLPKNEGGESNNWSPDTSCKYKNINNLFIEYNTPVTLTINEPYLKGTYPNDSETPHLFARETRNIGPFLSAAYMKIGLQGMITNQEGLKSTMVENYEDDDENWILYDRHSHIQGNDYLNGPEQGMTDYYKGAHMYKYQFKRKEHELHPLVFAGIYVRYKTIKNAKLPFPNDPKNCPTEKYYWTQCYSRYELSEDDFCKKSKRRFNFSGKESTYFDPDFFNEYNKCSECNSNASMPPKLKSTCQVESLLDSNDQVESGLKQMSLEDKIRMERPKLFEVIYRVWRYPADPEGMVVDFDDTKAYNSVNVNLHDTYYYWKYKGPEDLEKSNFYEVVYEYQCEVHALNALFLDATNSIWIHKYPYGISDEGDYGRESKKFKPFICRPVKCPGIVTPPPVPPAEEDCIKGINDGKVISNYLFNINDEVAEKLRKYAASKSKTYLQDVYFTKRKAYDYTTSKWKCWGSKTGETCDIQSKLSNCIKIDGDDCKMCAYGYMLEEDLQSTGKGTRCVKVPNCCHVSENYNNATVKDDLLPEELTMAYNCKCLSCMLVKGSTATIFENSTRKYYQPKCQLQSVRSNKCKRIVQNFMEKDDKGTNERNIIMGTADETKNWTCTDTNSQGSKSCVNGFGPPVQNQLSNDQLNCLYYGIIDYQSDQDILNILMTPQPEHMTIDGVGPDEFGRKCSVLDLSGNDPTCWLCNPDFVLNQQASGKSICVPTSPCDNLKPSAKVTCKKMNDAKFNVQFRGCRRYQDHSEKLSCEECKPNYYQESFQNNFCKYIQKTGELDMHEMKLESNKSNLKDCLETSAEESGMHDFCFLTGVDQAVKKVAPKTKEKIEVFVKEYNFLMTQRTNNAEFYTSSGDFISGVKAVCTSPGQRAATKGGDQDLQQDSNIQRRPFWWNGYKFVNLNGDTKWDVQWSEDVSVTFSNFGFPLYDSHKYNNANDGFPNTTAGNINNFDYQKYKYRDQVAGGDQDVDAIFNFSTGADIWLGLDVDTTCFNNSSRCFGKSFMKAICLKPEQFSTNFLKEKATWATVNDQDVDIEKCKKFIMAKDETKGFILDVFALEWKCRKAYYDAGICNNIDEYYPITKTLTDWLNKEKNIWSYHFLNDADKSWATDQEKNSAIEFVSVFWHKMKCGNLYDCEKDGDCDARENYKNRVERIFYVENQENQSADDIKLLEVANKIKHMRLTETSTEEDITIRYKYDTSPVTTNCEAYTGFWGNILQSAGDNSFYYKEISKCICKPKYREETRTDLLQIDQNAKGENTRQHYYRANVCQAPGDITLANCKKTDQENELSRKCLLCEEGYFLNTKGIADTCVELGTQSCPNKCSSCKNSGSVINAEATCILCAHDHHLDVNQHTGLLDCMKKCRFGRDLQDVTKCKQGQLKDGDVDYRQTDKFNCKYQWNFEENLIGDDKKYSSLTKPNDDGGCYECEEGYVWISSPYGTLDSNTPGEEILRREYKWNGRSEYCQAKYPFVDDNQTDALLADTTGNYCGEQIKLVTVESMRINTNSQSIPMQYKVDNYKVVTLRCAKDKPYCLAGDKTLDDRTLPRYNNMCVHQLYQQDETSEYVENGNYINIPEECQDDGRQKVVNYAADLAHSIEDGLTEEEQKKSIDEGHLLPYKLNLGSGYCYQLNKSLINEFDFTPTKKTAGVFQNNQWTDQALAVPSVDLLQENEVMVGDATNFTYQFDCECGNGEKYLVGFNTEVQRGDTGFCAGINAVCFGSVKSENLIQYCEDNTNTFITDRTMVGNQLSKVNCGNSHMKNSKQSIRQHQTDVLYMMSEYERLKGCRKSKRILRLDKMPVKGLEKINPQDQSYEVKLGDSINHWKKYDNDLVEKSAYKSDVDAAIVRPCTCHGADGTTTQFYVKVTSCDAVVDKQNLCINSVKTRNYQAVLEDECINNNTGNVNDDNKILNTKVYETVDCSQQIDDPTAGLYKTPDDILIKKTLFETSNLIITRYDQDQLGEISSEIKFETTCTCPSQKQYTVYCATGACLTECEKGQIGILKELDPSQIPTIGQTVTCGDPVRKEKQFVLRSCGCPSGTTYWLRYEDMKDESEKSSNCYGYSPSRSTKADKEFATINELEKFCQTTEGNCVQRVKCGYLNEYRPYEIWDDLMEKTPVMKHQYISDNIENFRIGRYYSNVCQECKDGYYAMPMPMEWILHRNHM